MDERTPSPNDSPPPHSYGALLRPHLDHLAAQARQKLPAKLQRRFDPEDVVQSVLRSLLHDARAGAVEVRGGDELAALLATRLKFKIGHLIEQHVTAAKRAIAAERGFGSADSFHALAPSSAAISPSPEMTVAVREEIDRVFARLPPDYAIAAEHLLMGLTVAESAELIGSTQAWVRRARERVRDTARQLEAD